MARDKITEYSSTASENTVVGDVNIAENSALPSDMNNAVREVLSHLKEFSAGTSGLDVLSFQDDDNSHQLKFQAPSSVTTTTTFTLPDGDGSNGQAIVTNGSGTLSFSNVGGMELLHTTTVTSNVGQVVIDGHFTSAFKNYKVIGSNVHLDTDNRNLNLKFMSGGSLLTGSVHRSSMLKLQSNASSSLEGLVEATDTEFAKCLGQNIGNATGEHTNFEITLYDPLATDNFKAFSARANNMSDIERMILSHTEGFYNNGQSALSGIEIVPSSGNIASGVFKLYGLR